MSQYYFWSNKCSFGEHKILFSKPSKKILPKSEEKTTSSAPNQYKPVWNSKTTNYSFLNLASNGICKAFYFNTLKYFLKRILNGKKYAGWELIDLKMAIPYQNGVRWLSASQNLQRNKNVNILKVCTVD